MATEIAAILPDGDAVSAEATDSEVQDTESQTTDDVDAKSSDDADVSDQTGDEGEEQQTDDVDGEEGELIEFDFGGTKLSVPKDSLPPELAEQVGSFSKSIWADYTQKSQAVALKVTSVEARETAVGNLMTLNNEALSAYSHGLSLRGEIAELESIDMPSLWTSQPDEARRLSDLLSTKRQQFSQATGFLNAQEQKMQIAQNEEVVRRQTEGAEFIEKAIPGFKAQHLGPVLEYAQSNLGLTKEVAERDWALNPEVTVAVHKAMLWDKMQAKARKSAKSVSAQPNNSSTRRGSRATGTVDPSKLSADDWVTWRNKQIDAQRKKDSGV